MVVFLSGARARLRTVPRVPLLLLLAALLGGLLSSCSSSGTAEWRSKSNIASGWTASSWQLSQFETERLKRESRKAQRAGNREVCGAILQRPDGALELCFADNESRHAHSYLLSGESVQRMKEIAEATGATIIGSFHSHPSSSAVPGDGDLAGAREGNLLLIHSVRTGRTRLWQVIGAGAEKKAREVTLRVQGRRGRFASPLPPAPAPRRPDHLEDNATDRDVRS